MTILNDSNPYPEQLITQYKLPDDTFVLIRPARKTDADILKEFSRNLSNELKHLNYMESFKEFPVNMVERLTQIDYKKTMTLLAIYQLNKKETVVGMVHYITDQNGQNCEFDMIVSDTWQNKGIGTVLTESLINCAKDNGIKTIKIIILAANLGGIMLAKHFGFIISHSDDPTVVIVTKKLD